MSGVDYGWAYDIRMMHNKYKVKEWCKSATPEQRKELLKLRMRMLTEEYAETMDAYLRGDEEEFVDGIIDLSVIGIGTLDIVHVDAQRAWNEVMGANMAKEVGVKPGRPNPLGLPDLVKPIGWNGPSHGDNLGTLKEIL